MNHKLIYDYWKNTPALRDLVVIYIYAILIVVLATFSDVFEMFFEWSREYLGWRVDIFLTILVFLAFSFGIFSLRRWKELRREVAGRKQAEEQILRRGVLLDGINKVLLRALTCETDEEVGRMCLAVAEDLTDSKFGFVGEVNRPGQFDTIALSDPGWDGCRIPKSNAVVKLKDMTVRGIWGKVLKDEQSLIVNDPASHPDRVGHPKGHLPLTSFLGVPLKDGDRTTGMIALGNKESGYDLDDQQAVEALAVAFVEALNRKRAEGRIRQQMESLKKIDEMKSEFISIASHELRTPLTAIKSAIQLMLQGQTGEINETQETFLSLAEKNMNRFTNILNNILDISKIESGKIEIKFEQLDLGSPIELILSSLKPEADKKSVHLKMKLSKKLPFVWADREKVEQILTNLVGNAIKFTAEGGEVSVSAKPFHTEGDMVAVSVRDSGIGIPDDQLDAIFEKFHQVDGSIDRSVGGTGLGLAITKGLVESQHGKIWVESTLGKGSTFHFTLPMAKGDKREVQFQFILDREFRRAEGHHSPLTLFLIEVMHQRAKVRDDLVGQLEEKLKRSLYREADIVVRGGDPKLLAALCEADLKGAQVIRRRIEEQIQRHPVKGRATPSTIQVGMATYPEDAVSRTELFGKAKQRLAG